MRLTTTFSESEILKRGKDKISWEEQSFWAFPFGTFVRISNEEFRTVEWREISSGKVFTVEPNTHA
jgi:hypothetical protein